MSDIIASGGGALLQPFGGVLPLPSVGTVAVDMWADIGVTVDGGDNLTAWVDQSDEGGNDVSFLNTSGGSNPITRVTDVLDGAPAILISGGGLGRASVEGLTGGALGNTGTTVLVARATTSGAIQSGPDGGLSTAFRIRDTGAAWEQRHDDVSGTGGSNDNGWHIFLGLWNDADPQLYLDDMDTPLIDGSAVTCPSQDGWGLGRGGAGTGGATLYVRRYIVFRERLTSADDRNAVKAHLRSYNPSLPS